MLFRSPNPNLDAGSDLAELCYDVERMVYAVLDRVLSSCKASPARLTAREKREVVEELNARGVFLLKGAVTEVARRLAVSEQTVYRYLKS